MISSEINKLCFDWLEKNYGKATASEYTPYSLVIPIWNSPDLNKALEKPRQLLCISFGEGEAFGTVGYQEARRKLGMIDDIIPIPEIFIEAFAGTCE